MMETVLITGGTGLIGKALTILLLQNNYRVIVLTRNKIEAAENFHLDKAQTMGYHNLQFAEWNVKEQTIDKAAFTQADHIIHLSGAGVADKRWSDKRKQEIVDSRTHSSALLIKSIREIPNKVKSIISASAIGWYGPDPKIPNPKPFTEEIESAKDFLGSTCYAWEKSIEPVTNMDIRLVILRTGIVLSNEGGAFVEFKKPLRFGIAAILGSGNQVVSWIHIDDLCRMYLQAIQNDKMNGVYNAVATTPVSNKVLTDTLAQKKRGRFYIPIYVPSFVLKMVLGEMSIEVLKSATVSNVKMRNTGFQFIHPHIDNAIDALVKE